VVANITNVNDIVPLTIFYDQNVYKAKYYEIMITKDKFKTSSHPRSIVTIGSPLLGLNDKHNYKNVSHTKMHSNSIFSIL
jgi:hypothetical protein